MKLQKNQQPSSTLSGILTSLVFIILFTFASAPVYAHCDSYDGPTVKDALKALETNNVSLVLKWISPNQEKEIIPLFNKTVALRSGDKEVYAIVEKHFLETLVRLHRETEKAPYTGLKAAGTTKPIVLLSDQALKDHDIDGLLSKLNNHIGAVLSEKYEKLTALEKVKESTPEQGRAYVAAYVDYTHTIEALHGIIEHGGGHGH